MLYYWAHLIYIYLGATFFWKKVDLADNLTRQRRVSLLDCEALRYMSNAKYFYYMDLIRFEILFRTKLYDNTFKKGIYPVLGSQKIIYKRPLKRWTTFNITLQAEGWDDKWVYHKQIFSRDNEVYAIGITKVAFWKKKQIVNMTEILNESGIQRNMNPSKEILALFDGDYELLKETEIIL